ncbi:MAG: hypothetical protein ACOYXN_12900 [Acidobacteriota bacterium]
MIRKEPCRHLVRGLAVALCVGLWTFSCCEFEEPPDLAQALPPVLPREARIVALLYPSAGCPCRYAPLVEELKGLEKGGALVCMVAAPAPPRPEEGLGVPYVWNAELASLLKFYDANGEKRPFLLLVRRAPRPSVTLAAKVPRPPARQAELARLALALAGEVEDEP